MKGYQATGVFAASLLALGVLANAQAPQGAPAGQAPQGGGAPGQGRQGMPGGGRQGGGMMGMGGPTLPAKRTIHITGQNPGLQLRMVQAGPIVAEVNFWRVDYSPVGKGHVCYVMTGDGKGKDDLRLALTDNDKLEPFVTNETMSKLVLGFGTPPYKVVKATFKTTGDVLTEHSEHCMSPEYNVVATWRKITPGQLGGMSPTGFDMMFMISMAAEGEITINGRKQPGTVLPGPGRPPAYLAPLETWLK